MSELSCTCPPYTMNVDDKSVPKKSNHQAKVVRVTELLPHPDPETTSLALVVIDGYQLVVRKDSFLPGTLGVFIQPDSVVPQTDPFRFIWGEKLLADGTTSEKSRRITVRRFRGQYSEGLLLPLNDFTQQDLMISPTGVISQYLPVEGEDVSDRLGITHWNPDAGSLTR